MSGHTGSRQPATHGFGPAQRVEDLRLVRGRGTFCDDVQLPGMLHLAILRSPVAHATITHLDVTAAQMHPQVAAVLTGEMLAARGLAWMPTLAHDQQAVLVTDKVRFQGQEVACVVAESRYAARDALELIDVDYEPLPVVVDAARALDPDQPVIRDDRPDVSDNTCFAWATGDQATTEAAFAAAEVVVEDSFVFPRVHPAPMETCAAVADFDPATGRLTVWLTSQAPHAHRTMLARLTGLGEHKIRVISPDIGGGFGNKVPLYPGYLCAIAASMATGRPVKWAEDRAENLTSTSFARDFAMRGALAATREGRILGVRAEVLADHGAFDAVAVPAKFPTGFFGVFTGSYDIPAAYGTMTAVYTNKAPGGVAYSCSFRIAEAVYFIERLVDRLARTLKLDPAELRRRNFITRDSFPYLTATGWTYDSGDYAATLAECLRIAGYDDLRREQAERRARGELMGIGLSCFTEAVGAGPRRQMDILGVGMSDACDLEINPSGTAVLRISVQSQGQGHETTFAQIVSAELGLAIDDVTVVHGDTHTTPYGLGTYGSRSTPVSGAAAALVARQVRDRARQWAALLLDTDPASLIWSGKRFGVGDASVGWPEIAAAAYGTGAVPAGLEPGLRAQLTYDPDHLTNPNGAYLCVVDIDPATAVVTVRRMVAVDDCGNRINDAIVEGQIHRGLTDGVGIALMELIEYDEAGTCLSGSLMDYLIPSAADVPDWETGATVTPSPFHPLGAKGVGESATVGSPPAVVNAVLDALAPLGVDRIDLPMTPSRIWTAMKEAAPGAGPDSYQETA